MKNNLDEIVAIINKAINEGENAVRIIVDSITKKEIKEIRKKTGIKNIKDVTPLYSGQGSGKTEEYAEFIKAAEESQNYKFTYKNVLLEDGSIGDKMERAPLFVVIYTTDWQASYRKKSISEICKRFGL